MIQDQIHCNKKKLNLTQQTNNYTFIFSCKGYHVFRGEKRNEKEKKKNIMATQLEAQPVVF
jgi:hypothetical protein